MVWAVLLCLAASCTASGGSEAADGTSPPGEKGANSADRVLFWIGQKEFVALSDKDLRRWHETYGVDGFVASTQWLNEMGGNQQLSTDPNADLGGDAFTLQRTLRDSKIVARAHDMGMKLYLGFYLANVLNGRTPLREWFDENGWQNVVLPRVAEFARGAKALGFDGLALDSEMYPQADGTANATWAVGYPGNTHPAAETRAMATRRGKQLMEAIVGAFPDVELQVYGSSFPDSWAELVQQEINGVVGFNGLLDLDFWNGMTSATGYQAVRFSDAIFYKTPHLSGSRWDTANQYNVERTYALLSRRLSNWSYASSRIFVSPFAWVDAGATEFERARSPDQVAEQLDAFRTWATGGEFLNYAQGLGTFDYRPYRKALVEASTPARVDTVAPTLMVGEVTRDGSTVKIAGSARDNLGVRAVHWSEVGGAAAGAAPMTWTTISGDRRSGWDWQMDWSFDGIEVPPGTAAIAITVEDIKGLTTTVNVPVPD